MGVGASELAHLHQGVTEIWDGSEADLVGVMSGGTNCSFGSLQHKAKVKRT